MSSSTYLGGIGDGPARDYSDYFVLPAAPVQRQLWFVCQLDEGGNAAYNVTSAVRLTGPLDVVVLQKALNEVIARHESLRTGVGPVDGDPHQVVVPETSVSLPVVDCSDLAPDAAAARTQELARELAARPFVLDDPPLLRVLLVREAPRVHALIVVIHHIVCDGWSTEVFYRDLGESYQRLRAGGPAGRDELPIQYTDYVVWQQDALAGAGLRELAEHWSATLAGSEPLDLPVDHPRGAERRMVGAREEAVLDEAATAATADLAARWDATPFMVLLAAFEIALARVTGQDDLAVGTPVAGRHHPDAESLIGFFANTLVLRTRLPLRDGVGAVVEAVRDTCLDAFSHERMPFDRLVEQMQPDRTLGRNPLFDVMFSMQSTPGVTLELPDLQMASVDLDVVPARFDLWLTVLPDGERLRLRLDYDRDLYDRATARGILDVYRAVLAAVAAHPDAVVPAELPPPDPADLDPEIQRSPGLPPALPAATVPDLLARRDAAAPALVADGEELTHAELARRADELVACLRAAGVGPGVVVATGSGPSTALVVAMLAVLRLGAVLTTGRRAPRDGAHVRAGAEGWRVATGPRFEPPEPAGTAGTADPDRPAWRAGWTEDGRPLEFSHRALVAATAGVVGRLGITDADDVVVLGRAGPPDLVELLAGLAAGRRLRLGDEPPAPPGAAVLFADPATWRRVLGDGARPPAGARLVCRGEVGDDVVAALARAGGPVFVGRTSEVVAGGVSLDRVGAGRRHRAGPPLAHTVRRLLDPGGAPVASGTVGELHVAGPTVALAHLDPPDPGAADTDRPGVATGELWRHTASGELEFVRYADGRLAVGDHAVVPERIERVLAAVDGVRDAAVVAGPVGPETAVVAWLVPTDPHDATSPERLLGAARTRARAELAEHEVPAAFGVLPAFPRRSGGDLDRPALTGMCRTSLLAGVDDTPPRTRLERTVFAAFREVLPKAEFGVHADFFALGGRSVLAAKVIGRLRDELGLLVGVRDFFRRPTAAALASTLAALEQERDRAPETRPEAMADQLAGMSDDEVARLLRQLDGPAAG